MAYSQVQGRGVQVTERGLIHYTDDLVSWIPRETGVSVAWRAAGFMANGRCILVGEGGAVGYSDDLGALDFFRMGQLSDAPTENWLEGLAVSDSIAVAVGDAGSIYSSTNGANWVRQVSPIQAWLTAVTHGQKGFVAVGEEGAILHSVDGLQWDNRSVVGRDWLGVTYGGGQYIAVGRGGQMGFSSSGQTWSLEQTGRTNDLWFASVNGTFRLVGGTFELLLSERGGPWLNQLQRVSYPAPLGVYYSALPRTNSFIVAGRAGAMIEGYQADPGQPYFWVDVAPALRSFLWDSTRVADLWVVTGDRGTVMTSENGIDWEMELTPTSVRDQAILGVGGDSRMLLAAGTDGSLIRSVHELVSIPATNVVNGLPVVTNVLGSTLGVVWSTAVRPTSNRLFSVTHGHGLYLLCGDEGEIFSSVNGSNWIKQTSGSSEVLSGLSVSSGGFVVCGQKGELLRGGTDARQWQRISGTTSRWLFRARSTGDLDVVVGEGGSFLISSNRAAFTALNVGTTEFLTDVAWLDGVCMVSGLNGTLLSTTNYSNWAVMNPFTYRDLMTLSVGGGLWSAAGEDGVILRGRWRASATPVEVIAFSRTVNITRNTVELLFLLGGDPDQR
ncbi:MAG: hypothetical protein FJ405_19315, partial [Verrucomicrobia bacterium]|nr:hypothetical protein [Verrucomicrobiota bacterium]